MKRKQADNYQLSILLSGYCRKCIVENHIAHNSQSRPENTSYLQAILYKPFVTYLKYYLALFLTIAPSLVTAQKNVQPLIDSLLTELLNSKEDTNKVKLLDQLSHTYSNINPDEGIKFGKEALDLSQTIRWEKGMGLALVDLGIDHEVKSDHVNALNYYQKALAHYEGIGDKASIAKVLVYTSFVYIAQSKYSSALSCDFKALNINENIGERKGSAIVMEGIGSIYYEQKEYSKAAEYYANALRVSNDLEDKESIARNLTNEGIILEAQGNHAEALKQYLKALKINEDLGKINYVQINLANIGEAYSQLKDYQNALKCQLHALQISEKIGSKNIIAINLGNIGETYLRMYKDTDEHHKPVYLQNSLHYLAKAVSICTEINYPAPLIEFSRYLSEAYYLSHDYKKAFESLNQYSITQDSVFSLQNKSQIINLEQEHEDDLKNKQIIIKDKQIEINALTLSKNYYQRKLYIAGITLLLFVIGVVIKNLYVYRKRNSVLKMELKKESDEKILSKEKLQESEEDYKSLFNLSPLPMWVLDTESLAFLQVNESAIRNYGYTNEEFLSMTIKDIKMEEDLEILQDDLQKNINQGTALNIFTRHRTKDNQEFYVDLLFNRIPFRGQIGILVIAEDISIQVDYIKAIEIQNDKLREIAWIQSHKVRSPLATILGLVNMLNEDLPEVEFKEVLRGIIVSSKELDNVIREITENTSTYDVSSKYPAHIKKLFPDNFNIPYRNYSTGIV